MKSHASYTRLSGMLLTLLLIASAWPALGQPSPPPKPLPKPPTPVSSKPLAERGLRIAVDANAAPEIKAAADKLFAAVPANALLTFMAGAHAPKSVEDTTALLNGPVAARAFDHLILIGLPTDPLIQAAWAHEAKFTGQDAYVYGFGYFHGDIGYVESDRNPFLHSRRVEKNLYETEIILLTGTTPRGVSLAVDAFLKGLVNGVVGGPGWTRPRHNLLERDPLPADWTPPGFAPAQLGEWTRAGFTQPNEDEARGVEFDTAVPPKEIWRVKYVRPGVWDGVGANAAFVNYASGLHRRAYTNSVWMGRFADAKEAAAKWSNIAGPLEGQNDFKQQLARAKLPPYGFEKDSAGDLTCWRSGDKIFVSSLPAPVADQLRAAMGPP